MKCLVGASALLLLSVPPSAAQDSPWEQLAECESSNTNADTGNGYSGYFQFDDQTWRSTGRSGRAADYSKAEQTAAAQDLYAARGGQPWPNCWPGEAVQRAVSTPSRDEAVDVPVTRPATVAVPTQGESLAVTG